MDIPSQTPQPVAAAAEPLAAGFWIRAGAYMIDGVLVMVGQLLLFGLFVVAGIPHPAAQLASSLLGIAYFVWMPVANEGQTVGKMAAGIAVMRMGGVPLTYGRCLARWAGYILSSLTLGLGFIIAAFTERKRGLHDYLADTRVVWVAEVGSARKALVVLAAFVPVLFGIAAALAVPQFMRMAGAAAESSATGSLASLRAGVAQYRAENAGRAPAQLSDLIPKALPRLPALKVKEHPQSGEVAAYDASVCAGTAVDPAKVKDTGRWGYVSDPAAPCYGAVFVDCVHADSSQKQWASY